MLGTTFHGISCISRNQFPVGYSLDNSEWRIPSEKFRVKNLPLLSQWVSHFNTNPERNLKTGKQFIYYKHVSFSSSSSIARRFFHSTLLSACAAIRGSLRRRVKASVRAKPPLRYRVQVSLWRCRRWFRPSTADRFASRLRLFFNKILHCWVVK